MPDAEMAATFRFYIDGKVAMSDRVTGAVEDRLEQVGELAVIHAGIVEDCEELGRKWMIEVVFSDGEHVRWGSDVDGMVVPVEVGAGELMAAILRRWQ